MATKKKISRKKLREPDEFVSTTTQILEYVSDNWKVFVAGGVVLLLVVGGVFMWRAGKIKTDKKAFALYHVIQKETTAPSKTDQTAVSVCGAWDKLKNKFPGTPAAMYGALRQTACFIENRAYQKGVEEAASLLQNRGTPGVVRVLALFLKGCGLEEKKAYREAEAAFQALLKDPENFLKDTTRYHLYLCQLNKGDKKKAKATLAGLKLEAGSDFPFPPILIRIDKARLGLENKS
jgi:hypothetical protein